MSSKGKSSIAILCTGSGNGKFNRGSTQPAQWPLWDHTFLLAGNMAHWTLHQTTATGKANLRHTSQDLVTMGSGGRREWSPASGDYGDTSRCMWVYFIQCLTGTGHMRAFHSWNTNSCRLEVSACRSNKGNHYFYKIVLWTDMWHNSFYNCVVGIESYIWEYYYTVHQKGRVCLLFKESKVIGCWKQEDHPNCFSCLNILFWTHKKLQKQWSSLIPSTHLLWMLMQSSGAIVFCQIRKLPLT